jgi:membrane protein
MCKGGPYPPLFFFGFSLYLAGMENKYISVRIFLSRHSQRVLHFLRFFWKELDNDNCILRASSLAFSTLLALVPLTAFVFSLLTGFGAFETVRTQLQDFLFRFLIPTQSESALVYIERFIENSRALGVVGLLIFALTSIFLLNGISTNINAIWASTSRVGFIRKFMMYLAVIVIGSLLVGASFTLSITLQNFAAGYPDFSAILKVLLQAAPTLFIFIVIWLMVYAVPSAKVSFRSSLLGAAAGTLLWEIARFLFIDGTNYVLRLSIIYGSLAAIPIFLVWLSLNWLIIFAAAEITYVHQHRGNFAHAYSSKEVSLHHELLTGLQIYLYIASRFLNGEPPTRLQDLSRHFSIPTKTLEKYIHLFEQQGLLFRSPSANPHILPQKELARTSVAEVLEALWGPEPHLYDREGEEKTLERTIVAQFSNTALSSFEDTSILTLLSSDNADGSDET